MRLPAASLELGGDGSGWTVCVPPSAQPRLAVDTCSAVSPCSPSHSRDTHRSARHNWKCRERVAVHALTLHFQL